MKLEQKGKDLILTIETQGLTPSASGKTLVLSSTHGNVATTLIVKGKPVIVGFNAYISNK
ncbi:MAG: hypothetical protein WC373_04715 [Smithella sp.]|jgi:hypothetical protein